MISSMLPVNLYLIRFANLYKVFGSIWLSYRRFFVQSTLPKSKESSMEISITSIGARGSRDSIAYRPFLRLIDEFSTYFPPQIQPLAVHHFCFDYKTL